MKQILRHLDLQAQVISVLIAVIVPTFVIGTIAENKITRPILEEEIKQVGITSGKTLATEIDSNRLLSLPNPTPAIENRLQEILFSQPNIVRIDVVIKDPLTGAPKVIASNIEEDPGVVSLAPPLVEAMTSDFKEDEMGVGSWEISIPIEHKGRDSRAPKKLLGTVHVVISLKLVGRILTTVWKTTGTAAAFSVVVLILVLSYFLRKTISNDRLLRQAESQNLQLTSQLHDAQRQVMNTEKLAVMGQLTASFAHEIGTPLNAIGGHLQLLKEDLVGLGGTAQPLGDRVEIINGQLQKIELVVKGFLQSTAKPTSQTQLTDVNQLADKTLEIVRPRIDAMGVEVKRSYDREMGPVRVVPLDIDQILLNLVNNSLDSLKSKVDSRDKGRLMVEVHTQAIQTKGRQWAEISVYDTGEGIKKQDLKKVLKPFFTTKRPGEGTGLGLAICQQLAHKYGGILEIDSKEGAWTRVTLRIPYDTNS